MPLLFFLERNEKMAYINKVVIRGKQYNLENLTDGDHIVRLPNLTADDIFVTQQTLSTYVQASELTNGTYTVRLPDTLSQDDVLVVKSEQDLVNTQLNSSIMNKVDKVDGKGLSTNDYTNTDKEKLAGLKNYELPIANKDALGGVQPVARTNDMVKEVGVDAAGRLYTEYDGYAVEIVDSLPNSGEANTFYLVANYTSGGYDKYWWVNDEWDSFNGASTVVVSELPTTGDESVDYIVCTDDLCMYYKWIDGQWKMISGSMADVVTVLPETGNEMTDYYVPKENGLYAHYRFIDGVFCMIGGDSYTKEEIDAKVAVLNSSITTVSQNLAATDTNLSSLSRALDTLRAEFDDLQIENNSYYEAITRDEDTGNYILTLYEVTPDGVESPKSVNILPATGGGGGAPTTELVVDRITTSPLVITKTDTAVIAINYSSKDGDGEPVDGVYSWKTGTNIIKQGNLLQGRNEFDLTEFVNVGTQKFTLTVTDDGGNTVVKTWTVQMVDVRIESSFSDRATYEANKTINFTYTPYGAVQKTVHFVLDGEELPSVTTTSSGTSQSYILPAKPHGAHLLECYITATVNGVDVETEHIYKDIVWYDATSTVPVIGCVYRNDYYGEVTARQYDTTNIVYYVFDPNTTTPTVTRSVDDEVVSTITMQDIVDTWAYKSSDVGTHTLVISCRETSLTIQFDITELGIDVSPVSGGLAFDFNPTGMSNNDADRLWTDSTNTEIGMTVSDNFDWQNGGYQIDEDGNQYFCVKAGTRAYINYNLFAGNASSNISTHGMEFKTIFKVTNVQDVDANWLSCYDGTVGLKMNAHNAYMYTSASDENNDMSYLYMPYSEEDIIELEINIHTLNQDDDGATSYAMSYEDGVGLKALIYDSASRMYQYEAVPITIGSDQCDIRIYRMKAYGNDLSDTDILQNFIADARSSEDMLARYDRNQIYDENGNLTPESVAAACPWLRVIKIDAPYFTNDKKDFVKHTSVECIYGDGDPVLDNWTFKNGYHSGQGTTSNEYGYAARNLDIIFNCDGENIPYKDIPVEADYVSTLTLGDGTTFNGRSENCKVSLTRTSVPNNWFNLKVNVASSEMGNNALLQKRFNDYLTYRSLGQIRDPHVKNTMEFVNCVIFVRENSEDLSTHREYQDRAWHFYSLANIGDSKKTDYSRAYDQTDMNEFTLEIADNTLHNSSFQTGVYMNNGVRTIETPEEVLEGTGTARTYVYPILESEWNENNGRYVALAEDQFEGFDDETNRGSFEMRYGCCGDFKDGKLLVKSEENSAQLAKNADVFRAFYKWVVTATDEEFVNELSEWFVEDSALYWYVFTTHFTMIDNRAKNSFWHFARTGTFRQVHKPMAELLHVYCELSGEEYVRTEDVDIDSTKTYYTEYAFDMWGYDFDTAAGINNSGELTMPYGREDIDYKKDGDATSGWLYNAADSTFWCRIRDLMHNQCSTFYQNMDTRCWSADNIINEYDNWQGQFPEELWRLDIERKYLRTYRGEGMNGGQTASPTPRFLRSMMQGRKKYQRRQWVRDQEAYMGTKYLTSNIRADQIMFRCNTPSGSGLAVAPNYNLKIVPYSDMYLSVMFGNASPQQIRAKAGVEYQVICPFTQMTDTAVLIYCASRIQGLNDLSACYIHDNDFSKATKLKKLIIGSSISGYNNPYLTILNMGDNVLLEELDVRNCKLLSGSLNLSSCNNLLKLYAEGSSIKAVVFSVNGKIQIAHLPASINSLSMRYLNYLTDLQVESWDNLETLVVYGGIVDMLGIVEETVDTVQTLTLYDVDWTITSTELLNQILKMNNSVLAGTVHVSGAIRNQEILSYAEAWSDLEVTYEPQNLVTQFLVTFLNDDGAPIIDKSGNAYTQWVDQGGRAYDPIARGEVNTPTKQSTAQYDYAFSDWLGIDNTILNNATITANYSESIRTYTVRWLKQAGLVMKQVDGIPYGGSAQYDGEYPTMTDGESAYMYKIFTGWDKSTGYITENTDVYAQWETQNGLPNAGTELSAMTPVQLYAVSAAGAAEDFFEDKDSISIRVGNDFTFSNVEEAMIADEKTLTGKSANVVDTGIKLFGANERSFTIAVDFEFGDNVTDGTLLSCFEYDGSEGFRIKWNGTNPELQWGNVTKVIGNKKQRDIVVLRHVAGENTIHVYSFNSGAGTDLVYADTISYDALTRNRSVNTEATIVVGGFKFLENGVIDDMGVGTIHWAKVWFADLGDDMARQLAAWPHENWTFEYYGSNRYRLSADSSRRTGMSFISKDLLALNYVMNEQNTNVGGWHTSKRRTFCNNRIYNAFPTEWKSLIKQAQIRTTIGNMSHDIATSDDYIYMPSYAEVIASQDAPYTSEGSHITWFVNDTSRIKTQNGVAAIWSGRSPIVDYNTYFLNIGASGSYSTYRTAYTPTGICPCFSV